MARTSQRSVPIALIVIAGVLLAARFTYTPPKRDDGQSLVRWFSPQVGIERAKDTGKPILIYFTAEWCGPCHVLEAEVFADPLVAGDLNDRFIAVKVTDRMQEDGVNTPEVAALEQRYSVRGFPTIVFADANGSEQGRMEGYRGREQFERIVERIR
jgi:thiol:disulfide interchange protein